MNNVSDNYRSSSSTTNGRQTANVDAERRDSTGTKYEKWPSSIGRMFAALSCTLGLFNISRFSIFSIVFGGKKHQLLQHETFSLNFRFFSKFPGAISHFVAALRHSNAVAANVSWLKHSTWSNFDVAH